jgi:hypothetical protein
MCIAKQLVAVVIIGVMAAAKTVSAADSALTDSTAPPTVAGTNNSVRMGKELRHEIRAIYADLKREKAFAPPLRGNDVTAVVLKYIPVGTSFEVAEAILRNAGCKIGVHPADIPNPSRPLNPQEPVLATLPLGGWPLGHFLSVALVPRENGDYSTVVRVSAAILMAYS